MRVSHNIIGKRSAAVKVSQMMVVVSKEMRVGRGRYWLGRRQILR